MVAESDEAVDKLVLVVENLNADHRPDQRGDQRQPGGDHQGCGARVKTVARQANREARMTSGRTEDTFTGTEVVEP